VLSAQPKMECYLTMPKELVFDSKLGIYIPDPFKVEVTLTNKGDSNALNIRMRSYADPALGIIVKRDTTTQYGWLINAVPRKIGDTVMICALFSFSNHPEIRCCEKIWIPVFISTDVGAKENNPSSFYLGQNYPNSFAQSTTINLPLLVGEGRGEVIFKIYDIFGREVLDLSKDVLGKSSLVISNSQLPTQGIYFYRLTVGNESQTKIMTLIK
jgi:hypothetical protein